MPRLLLNEEQMGAMVTALLAFTKEEVPLERQKQLSEREAAVEAGRQLIRQKNCMGCHLIDEHPEPKIRQTIADQGYWPPILLGEGRKVNPDWLFKFFKDVQTIRPWLHVRMPTFEFTDEEANTLAKNFRFPSAAHRAILSAYLAEEGFTGPARVLEGQRGFVEAVFQGDYQLDTLSAEGQPFHILENRYKPFAAESTAHGHLSATLHLVKTHDLKPADIESVTVRAGSRAIAHTGDAAKRHPMDKETADHSSWYLTAVAIMDREVSPRQYARERYSDAAVEALMARITLEVANEYDRQPMAGGVVIRTRSGATLKHEVLHPKGTRENRMSDAEINDKFRDMAKVHMSEARIDRLLDALWKADQLEDVAALAPLLAFS